MKRSLYKWCSVATFNLMLVAVLGCLLRYKIAYSLPFVDQKFLLNAHSHFAFSGWVSLGLMILMIQWLNERSISDQFPKYRWVLWVNLLSAYGMLATFPFEGYATASIIFSTASIFASYIFIYLFWKDLNKLAVHAVDVSFFKAAMFFNILSSLGPFALAYMMATKSSTQDLYLAAIYFFLHFQYNGWFLFVCMGLFISRLYSFEINDRRLKPVFYLFLSACIPAYFLSALWIPLPSWVYVLVVFAGIAQLAGWIRLVLIARKLRSAVKTRLTSFSRILFLLCSLAYSIKLTLQAVSAIPSLGYLTYGFRPIVIGYLHLVLLGVVSLFIITYWLSFGYWPMTHRKKSGVIIFVTGIIVNEIFLMIQGIADLVYKTVPFINEALLAAAVVLLAGLVLMVLPGGNQEEKYPGKNEIVPSS